MGQRGLIALDWCRKEIRNGGFPQLFENSTGNLFPWAIDGFRMIGAEKYAAICSKAASMLGSDYPKSAAGRKKAYKSLSQSRKQEIDGLENAFYALLDSQDDDLERYRGNYVKSHPEQFVQTGLEA